MIDSERGWALSSLARKIPAIMRVFSLGREARIMRGKKRVLRRCPFWILFLALVWGCGSRPPAKVMSLARTEGTADERAAEGKVLLVVEVNSGRDLGSKQTMLEEFLRSCRLTDTDGADFGNFGYKWDRAKNPELAKLWWNVPREKTAFVLFCGKQRISLDAPREITPPPSPPPPAKNEAGKLITPVEIPAKIAEEQISDVGIKGGVEGGVSGAVGEVEAPVRAIGTVKPPKLLKQVDPLYPEIARQARVEGIVLIEATTDIHGRVQSCTVLRSIPFLDQAAIDAVKQWVYEPVIIDGRPRGVIFTEKIEFKLPKK